jgi:hypothetical protein
MKVGTDGTGLTDALGDVVVNAAPFVGAVPFAGAGWPNK